MRVLEKKGVTNLKELIKKKTLTIGTRTKSARRKDLGEGKKERREGEPIQETCRGKNRVAPRSLGATEQRGVRELLSVNLWEKSKKVRGTVSWSDRGSWTSERDLV